MEALNEIAVEFLIDCSQPQLCDCTTCDNARRAKVQAFSARWFAENDMDSQSYRPRCSETLRPVAFARAA
jgi:hypothetical protein